MFESDIRDLKVKIINNEFNFEIKENRIKSFKKELDFISHYFKDTDILSGSLALSLYGLIERNINDIDILINDENRYQHYLKRGYDIDLPNHLGYKYLKHKKNFLSFKKEYKVDFFLNKDKDYNELDYNGKKIKIHKPLKILEFKDKINSSKHHEDLYRVFNNIIL